MMRTSRSKSMPRLVHTMAARNATSMAATIGVNSRVSTGAMFSMTLCLASTSHEAPTTAPSAPQASTHDETNSPASMSMAANAACVSAASTPPPSAIST